jgi:hypothetical protein
MWLGSIVLLYVYIKQLFAGAYELEEGDNDRKLENTDIVTNLSLVWMRQISLTKSL